MLPTRNSTDLTTMRFAELHFCWTGIYCARPNTTNTKSREPEIKKIGEKLQYYNELILHNDLRNAREKQITEMIPEFDPKTSPFLGR